MVHARIIGTGAYVPEDILTNHDLEQIVDTSDQWITERTGIKVRHRVKDETTSDLAAKAAIRALEMAQLDANELDLIIVATITPDYIFPSVSCLIKSKIGAKRAAAFDLSAGCSGLVYGLSVAKSFIISGQYRHILVIGAEVLTSIVNWEDRNTCVLFGDGAGAVVVGPSEEPGIIDYIIAADDKDAMELCLPAGGVAQPITCELIEEKQNKLYMNGAAIFKLGVKAMATVSRNILKKNHMTPADIDWLIPHQANIRIIQSVGELLKIDPQKVIINVENYGNTSAASIGLALDEAIRDGRIQKGHHVVLTAFGAGLTWAGMLFRY